MPENEYFLGESLNTLLREAADDASRRSVIPSCDLVEDAARGRRTNRVAAAGVFGVVLCLAIGVAAAVGAGRDRDPDRLRPAASAVTLDPALRQYWTKIPILTWTPDAGHKAEGVRSTEVFRTAVFSELGPGDHDGTYLDDLRTWFPGAPVGGQAIAIDKSVTRAQLEHAAANLRKIRGVRAAHVVDVYGLWFTVSATGPAPAPTQPIARGPRPPSDPPAVVLECRRAEPCRTLGPADVDKSPARTPKIDFEGTDFRGGAGSYERDAQNHWVYQVSGGYMGPAIDRTAFDLMRTRAAEAVHIDVSKVVVTAESAADKPEPTNS